MYDLVIIGSGPAGLGAAIYAQRAKLNTITIEKGMMSGGQVLTTYEVDNYPGLPGINGFDLATKLREHAEKLGAVFVEDEVNAIGYEGNIKFVNCVRETYETKAILIATGARHRQLGISGEESLIGKGVGYCAVCDGALYRNKRVAVVGGGDAAIEDAIFLSRICERVYLIHRREEFRAAKSLQHQLQNCKNVEILWNTVIEEVNGDDVVESIRIKELLQNKEEILPIDGLFVAVGISPNSDVFLGTIEDEDGYLLAGEDCETSVSGIFAAGDVRTKALRQIITAVSDGANAISSVEKYLRETDW